MLTAIEDFVQDSFDTTSDQSLDALRIGSDRSVWIEQGPKAMIAVVIRGTPPLDLRYRLAEILNGIHLKFAQQLDEYKGDAVAFDATRDDLRSCLGSELKASEKKTSPLLWVTAVALLAMILLWSLASFRQHRRSERFLAALRAQPGIVLTAAEKEKGRLVISGLKDPLTDDPAELVRAHHFSADQVEYRWRPYLSLEPELILCTMVRLKISSMPVPLQAGSGNRL